MKRKFYKNILTKEFLINEHHIKGKSFYKISQELCCDSSTVYNYVNLHKIYKIKPKYDNRKNKNHPLWKGYEDISNTYWKNVKNGAKNRNLIFELNIEEIWDLYIKQNKKCALSGIEIGFEASKSNTASLDRIDSNIGYVIYNVQWVHKKINYAKQSLNNKEFIELCKKVYKFSIK